MNPTSREVITDGAHTTEVINVLEPDLKSAGVTTAVQKAARIIQLAVDPVAGAPASPSDGLLYGLIQSGKTSILTVSAAMAADNGFDCILVLTSDNDLLYDQTLERIRAALRGLTMLGKKDWNDPVRFSRQVRTKPFGIVCSKNGNMLRSLLQAFETAKSKGLSVFIIDDEADQASLDTLTSKRNKKKGKPSPAKKASPVNLVITEFRTYFPVNTYLQVTATPQALFLQRPGHAYRPSFTVVTEPGAGYVGGDAFFGSGHGNLLRMVDINELIQLKASNQPTPSGSLPSGLKKSIYTFLVAAASKIIERPHDGFAFLCHVSMGNADHEYVRKLLDSFRESTIKAFAAAGSPTYQRLEDALREAYDDLATTEPTLPTFEEILKKIQFYLPGANIKLINAKSSDEIRLDSVFNLFIGGNKLGRGVTIKNLLVSYYGRNPKTPRADTVLQHARMYGYRKKDLGSTRLFLPQRLADHFTSMHEMETSLRDLLKNFPDGSFEGLYISGSWAPTRSNVLDPNTIGYYEAGKSYNPESPLRNAEGKSLTAEFDTLLSQMVDSPPCEVVTVDFILKLMKKVKLDPKCVPQFWDMKAIETALKVLVEKNEREKKKDSDRAYLVIQRGRGLTGTRGERKGIISGGEESWAPEDSPTLFFYRQEAAGSGKDEVWWPQLRFPNGNYVLAFSFDW